MKNIFIQDFTVKNTSQRILPFKLNAITAFTSFVWFMNGFYCKLLNFVPRHQEIVATLLSQTYARELTMLIGMGEVVLAIWILSSYKSRLSSIVQILLVAIMNVIEFSLVPEFLLWGHLNIIFAFCFIMLIGYNEFIYKSKSTNHE